MERKVAGAARDQRSNYRRWFAFQSLLFPLYPLSLSLSNLSILISFFSLLCTSPSLSPDSFNLQ